MTTPLDLSFCAEILKDHLNLFQSMRSEGWNISGTYTEEAIREQIDALEASANGIDPTVADRG